MDQNTLLTIIGDLEVERRLLHGQVEALRKKIKELEEKPEAET